MKWGCHCAYANENSVSCDQIDKDKNHLKSILLSNLFLVEGPWERRNKVAIGLRIYKSVEMIYKKKRNFLDYDVLCINERIRRQNFGT